MISINTLIVDDDKDSRLIIESGIKLYNEHNTKYQILVVGVASNYEEAKAILLIKDIGLIFLDINLPDNPTGLKLFSEVKDVSYIIVSKNREAWEIIFSETNNRPHDYIKKISEGNFNIDRVVKSIQKYLQEKGPKLHKSIIRYNGYVIDMNQTLCISRPVLKIQAVSDKDIFEIVKIGKNEGSNDNHHFCINRVKSSPSELSSQVLDSINISDNNPILSLDHIVEAFELDANSLIRISDSIILNIAFVERYDTKKREFLIKISNFSVPKLNVQQEISALLKGSSNQKYLTPDIEQRIMESVSARFYRP